MVAERPWYIPRKCNASFLLSGVCGCTLRLRCAARFVLRIIYTACAPSLHYGEGWGARMGGEVLLPDTLVDALEEYADAVAQGALLITDTAGDDERRLDGGG